MIAPRKVAIVLVSHHKGRFLGEAIESVLAQTRTADEIAVVDDSCDDHTEPVACSYRDRGVRYVRVEADNDHLTRQAALEATISAALRLPDAIGGAPQKTPNRARGIRNAKQIGAIRFPNPTPQFPIPSLKHVEFLIKSFRRFNCLRRLVESIRRFYPDVPIRIADDSFEDVTETLPPDAEAVRQTSGVTWHQFPFDVGLSWARNFLVAESSAEIVINLDDDNVFTAETRIEAMVTILEAMPDVSVVTGLIRWDGVHAANYGGRFRFESVGDLQLLHVDPLPDGWKTVAGVRYRTADLGCNFFAVRRAALLKAPWDEQFKICYEHMDHFLEMHRVGTTIVTTPDVILGHLQDPNNLEYVSYRQRIETAAQMMRDKWRFQKLPRVPNTVYPELLEFDLSLEVERQKCFDRPNRILLGVGQAGATITTQMLATLGWQTGSETDEQFCEHSRIRALNEDVLCSGRLDEEAARTELQKLPRPWVINDPQFVATIGHWMPLLAEWQPELVWLHHDSGAAKEDFRRRNGGVQPDGTTVAFDGKNTQELDALSGEVYRTWPWWKQRVRYHDIRQTVSRSDVRRDQPALRTSAVKKCLMLTNSLGMGGAEHWVADLTNGSRHRWTILAAPCNISDITKHRIQSPIISWDTSEQGIDSFDSKELAMHAALDNVDVIVSWGNASLWSLPSGAVHLSVSHACGELSRQLAADTTASRFAAVSEAAAVAYPGASVIHNGIDPDRLKHGTRRAARHRFGLPDPGSVAAYIGRVSNDKNCEVLAGSVQLLPDNWTVFYCGDGHGSQRIGKQIRSIAGHRVVIHPGITDVGNAYIAADVIVSTSRSEACSLALIEAWYLGIPVVSTRVGAIPELEREFGPLVVPLPNDPSPEDVARAVLTAKKGSITRRAKHWARLHGTSDMMCRRWDAHLDSFQTENVGRCVRDETATGSDNKTEARG